MTVGAIFDLIASGDEEMLREQLKSSDAAEWLSTPNLQGDFPLHVAAKMRNEAIMAVLLEAGADPNQRSLAAGTQRGFTAAHHCARMGLVLMLLLLKKHNADLSLSSEDGWRPLHCAAHSGRRGAIIMLLDSGVDINCVNNGGQTPLFLACVLGRTSEMQLLIFRGASTEMCDLNGNGIIHVATHYHLSKLSRGKYELPESQMENVFLLAASGAPMDQVNREGASALTFLSQQIPSIQQTLSIIAKYGKELTQGGIKLDFRSLESMTVEQLTALGMSASDAAEFRMSLKQQENERRKGKEGCSERLSSPLSSVTDLFASYGGGGDPSSGKCPFFRAPVSFSNPTSATPSTEATARTRAVPATSCSGDSPDFIPPKPPICPLRFPFSPEVSAIFFTMLGLVAGIALERLRHLR